MRKKVIAGNWKMNKDLNESQNLVSGIIDGLGNENKCDVVVCPPFTSLNEVHSLIKNTPIKLGAQNVYYETDGAFTGDDGLKVIFCIGESLAQREEGITNSIVEKQLQKGLDGISSEELNNIIIAYEPVWAIGTGKTATPEQAQEVHAFIRNYISQKYSKESGEGLIIQYGGSVKPDNAASLLSQPDIDGALIGGACLKADSFLSIIAAA
ncbi:MAG: triose-phosphate isomerase [Ignavibacteriaceae bacterium]